MTAEALIQENTRFDREGSPLEVVVPYETFIDFIEEYGLDLTQEEIDSIKEVKKNIAEGNGEDFISSEEVEKGLGLT